MAKKKSTNQSKKVQLNSEPAPELPLHRQSSDSAATNAVPVAAAMDDPSEQLKMLKSLNDNLVKQTSDGRDRIKLLEAELTQAREQYELEKVGLVEPLEREKTELKEKLIIAREDRDSLMSELARLKDSEMLVREEAEKLRVKCEGLALEKKESDKKVKDLKKENISIAQNLTDLNCVVDALKAESKRSAKEKSDLEARIGALENEFGAESKAASGLRADLQVLKSKNVDMEMLFEEKISAMDSEMESLRNDKAEKEKLIENLEFKLSETAVQWKRSASEADEKAAKIEELIREKSEAEEARVSQETETIKLRNEVGELRGALFESRNSCRDKEEKNVELISEIESQKEAMELLNSLIQDQTRELSSLENENQNLQSSIVELNNEVAKLKETLFDQEQSNSQLISKLEEERKIVKSLKSLVSEKEKLVQDQTREVSSLKYESKNQESTIVGLNDEVGKLKKVLFDEERSNSKLISDLEEERRIMKDLKSAVSEKEKRVEETVKELNSLREEHNRIAKKTDSKFALCARDRESDKAKVVQAEKRMEEWRLKAESAHVNSKRALTLVKKVASIVSGGEGVDFSKEKVDEEVVPFFSQLEAILKALSEKDKAMEAMNEKVEALKRSTDDANRKSFWTLVSSATTLFAAASVAYVAKGQR